MNEASTRKHLAKANKNIKAGSDRIRNQKERVKALAADGHSTEIAEKTLENFKNLEETMMKQRGLIRAELKGVPNADGSKTKVRERR